MKKIIPLIALCFALTACEEAPQPFKPGPLAFEQSTIAPLSVNVATIKITDNYTPPLRRPNVDQDFPIAPDSAIRRWVGARLKATGTSGVLEVVINDAAVKEVPLPTTKGVKGLFTDDQDARYDAHIAVTFRLFTGAQAMSDATSDVEVSRSHSINEKATIYQRQALFQQMINEMMNDFDQESNMRLHQYFARFLK